MDTLIFILVLAALAVFLFIRNKQRQAKVNPYEQELIKKFRGDAKKAQRLIDNESKRNPKLSSKQAAKNVLESLLRDQR